MAETKREKINKEAISVLEDYPNGISYSEFVRKVQENLPDEANNTIHGSIWDLDKRDPNISKPERGLWILTKYLSSADLIKKTTEAESKTADHQKFPSESSFYESFADYMVKDLDECTKAISLGGNRFGDRWGTPDVFGVYKFSETDAVRPPIEIISAEIKTDVNQLITAFGQACAYKIFSHKVYLVVPKESDTARIESLCARFGIGLILFDRRNSENPNWEIRTRAVKSEPDYFYLNEYIQRLGDARKSLF